MTPEAGASHTVLTRLADDLLAYVLGSRYESVTFGVKKQSVLTNLEQLVARKSLWS